MSDANELDSIVLGGGCFWCVESVFLLLIGVKSVESGYAGGHDPSPTYEKVCKEQTGHAEVIKVEFDSSEISLADLFEVFFVVHDPTTLNRQGNDTGTQYRSVILYQSEQQKIAAHEALNRVTQSKRYANPVVTEIIPLAEFYTAEAYHQDFYNKNPSNRYCQFSIEPKYQKLSENFSHLLKRSQA